MLLKIVLQASKQKRNVNSDKRNKLLEMVCAHIYQSNDKNDLLARSWGQELRKLRQSQQISERLVINGILFDGCLRT
jgi:hypothetical protein